MIIFTLHNIYQHQFVFCTFAFSSSHNNRLSILRKHWHFHSPFIWLCKVSSHTGVFRTLIAQKFMPTNRHFRWQLTVASVTARDIPANGFSAWDSVFWFWGFHDAVFLVARAHTVIEAAIEILPKYERPQNMHKRLSDNMHSSSKIMSASVCLCELSSVIPHESGERVHAVFYCFSDCGWRSSLQIVHTFAS